MACASPISCCKIFKKHAYVPQSQLPCNARVDNQQVHMQVRRRTHVYRHGYTPNRRLTMPTVSHRDQNSWTTSTVRLCGCECCPREPRTATSPYSSQVRSPELVKAVRSGNRPGSNNPKPKCHRLVHSGGKTGGDTSVPFVFIRKNHNSANSPYSSASYHFEPVVHKTCTSAGVR